MDEPRKHADHLQELAALGAVWHSLRAAQAQAKSELDVAVRAAHAAGVPRIEIAAAAAIDQTRGMKRILDGGGS